MNFPASISKEELKELPLLTFSGKIHLVEDIKYARQCLQKLSKETVLGFDTEKKPTFHKGSYHPTALLQFSNEEEAFLFRINKIGLPSELISILEDDNIKKVGVGIRDDIQELIKVSSFNPGGFVELVDITQNIGIKNAGVRSISGIILKQRVSKNQQTSNWENETLTKAQQLYAAADAWVPCTIYNLLDSKGFVYD